MDHLRAVDGLELFTHAVNMMREHIHPSSRMHYAIVKGGDVPNVVPEYGKVWIWLRDEKRDIVDEMLGRLRKMAAGSAMSADVESKVTVNGGDWNMLVNMTGERLAQQNLEWLGPLSFTPEEQESRMAIRTSAEIPSRSDLSCEYATRSRCRSKPTSSATTRNCSSLRKSI